MLGTLRADTTQPRLPTMDHSLTHPIAATAIAAAVSTLPLVAAAAITTAVAAIVSEISNLTSVGEVIIETVKFTESMFYIAIPRDVISATISHPISP